MSAAMDEAREMIAKAHEVNRRIDNRNRRIEQMLKLNREDVEFAETLCRKAQEIVDSTRGEAAPPCAS